MVTAIMEPANLSGLLEHREHLLGFIRKKIPNPEFAEDLLQESLLKALKAAPQLRDNDKIVPWFYRVVKNAIIDFYRSGKHRLKQLDIHEFEFEDASASAEGEATICSCFIGLIPTLKPEHEILIRELELSDGDPETMSGRLGITRNNLKVRRHRARQELRRRLEETCRVCAAHGCLDCTCEGT